MTQNKTLSLNNRQDDLQVSKSDSVFHLLRTVLKTVFFLCYFSSNIYYLTKNHKQQCLSHLKIVV